MTREAHVQHAQSPFDLVSAIEAVDAKAVVLLRWECRGPRHTPIAWLASYSVNGIPAIVETYADGSFDLYSVIVKDREITATVANLLNHVDRLLAPRPRGYFGSAD